MIGAFEHFSWILAQLLCPDCCRSWLELEFFIRIFDGTSIICYVYIPSNLFPSWYCFGWFQFGHVNLSAPLLFLSCLSYTYTHSNRHSWGCAEMQRPLFSLRHFWYQYGPSRAQTQTVRQWGRWGGKTREARRRRIGAGCRVSVFVLIRKTVPCFHFAFLTFLTFSMRWSWALLLLMAIVVECRRKVYNEEEEAKYLQEVSYNLLLFLGLLSNQKRKKESGSLTVKNGNWELFLQKSHTEFQKKRF